MSTGWLHSPTDLLVWAVVAHVVADWLLQTEWMAVNKANLRHPAGYVHAGVYTLLILPLFPWATALLIGFSHLLIDTRIPVAWWMRMIKAVPAELASPDDAESFRPRSQTKVFVEAAVDQSFHLVILAAAALAVFRWFR